MLAKKNIELKMRGWSLFNFWVFKNMQMLRFLIDKKLYLCAFVFINGGKIIVILYNGSGSLKLHLY